jgi:hypothetical protein
VWSAAQCGNREERALTEEERHEPRRLELHNGERAAIQPAMEGGIMSRGRKQQTWKPDSCRGDANAR